ncbi:MAG: S8 family peptidase, partial [Coriobacteriales bacterium]
MPQASFALTSSDQLGESQSDSAIEYEEAQDSSDISWDYSRTDEYYESIVEGYEPVEMEDSALVASDDGDVFFENMLDVALKPGTPDAVVGQYVEQTGADLVGIYGATDTGIVARLSFPDEKDMSSAEESLAQCEDVQDSYRTFATYASPESSNNSVKNDAIEAFSDGTSPFDVPWSYLRTASYLQHVYPAYDSESANEEDVATDDQTGAQWLSNHVVVATRPGTPDTIALKYASQIGGELVAISGGTSEGVVVELSYPSSMTQDEVEGILLENPEVVETSKSYVDSICEGEESTMGVSGESYYPYWTQETNLPKAWSVCKADTDVVVAVIDTGINFDSSIFGNRIDTAHDKNFVGKSTTETARDDNGHGTNVASLISGQSETGGLILTGASYGAKILPIKAANYEGKLDSKDELEALTYLYDLRKSGSLNIRVINMSFGGSRDYAKDSTAKKTYDSLIRSRINALHDSGVVLVASAGNCVEGGDFYPAAYSNVISVGATQLGNTHWETGKINDDLHHEGSHESDTVDICAPGAHIYVPTLDSTYEYGSGTSYAAPLVSGSAALLYEKYGRITPAEVEAILRSSAKDLGASGHDPQFGDGLLNAGLAVTIDYH